MGDDDIREQREDNLLLYRLSGVELLKYKQKRYGL